MKRREFSTRTKLQAFDRCGGYCEGTQPDGTRCRLKLRTGHITYDHRIPCEEGGGNSLDNCQVLGPCCDKPKTAQDQARFARGRAMRARHVGARTVKRLLPGSKGSGLRKKLDGTVWRET